jgi:hypothetical protein
MTPVPAVSPAFSTAPSYPFTPMNAHACLYFSSDAALDPILENTCLASAENLLEASSLTPTMMIEPLYNFLKSSTKSDEAFSFPYVSYDALKVTLWLNGLRATTLIPLLPFGSSFCPNT